MGVFFPKKKEKSARRFERSRLAPALASSASHLLRAVRRTEDGSIVTDRLTKNELTWLLTQEARTAAQKLRLGVGISSVGNEPQAPPPLNPEESSSGVESTLNQLDEAVSMLASLHGHPMSRGRRGKIDLAALVWEVAPEARVQLEMGEGTTVFGDEAELRRMLHVLISQSGD